MKRILDPSEGQIPGEVLNLGNKSTAMIHLNDVKPGDWVMADYEGKKYEGKVEEVSFEKIFVRIEFNDHTNWYDPPDVEPIPLTDDWLVRLGFSKSDDPEMNGQGQAWTKGPFVIQYPEKDNNQHLRLTYRSEEPRLIRHGLYVHELQHHYHGMTKVFLEN